MSVHPHEVAVMALIATTASVAVLLGWRLALRRRSAKATLFAPVGQVRIQELKDDLAREFGEPIDDEEFDEALGIALQELRKKRGQTDDPA